MGQEPEENSGAVATAGGDELPAGPSTDPTKPAAAAAVASSSDFGDPKTPSPFADERTEAERDATDKPSKPRVRDLLSEAVGAEMYGVNWSGGASWSDPATQREFSVSRYYMHPKIAVDFPTDRELEQDVPMKRRVLHQCGVAYIVVAPREEKMKDDIITAIEAERELLKGGK